MLILLDIDNTLLHSVYEAQVHPDWYQWFETYRTKDPEDKADSDIHSSKRLKVQFLRPGVREFIDFLYKKGFQVGIFTAGNVQHANHCIVHLFSERKVYPVLTLSQFDECKYQTGGFKDLAYVRQQYPEFQDEQIIIIDDLILVKQTNGENCYQIPPFYVCSEIKSSIDLQNVSLDQRQALFRTLSVGDNHLQKCKSVLEQML